MASPIPLLFSPFYQREARKTIPHFPLKQEGRRNPPGAFFPVLAWPAAALPGPFPAGSGRLSKAWDGT